MGMRLSPTGGLFGLVQFPADAQVVLPTGAARSAWIRLSYDGFDIEAYVDSKNVVLRPARKFTVGGVFVPQTQTPLAWVGGSTGKAIVQIALDRAKADPSATRAERPCDDLGLSYVWFEALEKDRLSGGELRVGEPIGVAATPGGAAIATLLLRNDDDLSIAVLAKRDGFLRIAFWGEKPLIVGWVPRAAVNDDEDLVSRDWLPPSVYGIGGWKDSARCARDIPLVGEVAGERRTFGVAHAGSRLHIDAVMQSDGFTPVALDPAFVKLAPGARILARATDLTACTFGT